MALDDGHAMAAEDDSITMQLAMQDAATMARLEGGKLRAAEALGPIRDERGVCRAGYRVLVDAAVRDEHPAGDRMLVTGRGDDRHAMDATQRGEVRRDCPHRRLVGDLDDGRVVAAFGQPDR